MRHMRSQSGGAALITVTFASFLILILTVAMTALMVGELRQATDAENSIKAYYTAESVAEQQVLHVKTIMSSVGRPNNPPCLSAGLTPCSITTSTKNAVLSLQKDDQTRYNLTNDTGLNSMQIKWGFNPDVNQHFSDPDITDPKSWPGIAPGAVDLAMVTFHYNTSTKKIDTSNGPSGPQIKNVLLVPCASGSSGGSNSCASGATPSPTIDFQTATGQQNVYCDQASPYICMAKVQNLPVDTTAGVGAVLVISSRFAGIQGLLSGANSAGALVDLLLPIAQIDVTAHNGDSYRRLEEAVTINTNPLGLNTVLFGDQDICKNFTDINTGGGPGGLIPGPGCNFNNTANP